ncbi:uncharacterized protein LOC109859344 [Pseudomyrmex gracilis]|uniref:uncharacterized protein LOC109859344 n=1 Tax=Pseudomyrmex gracilis TaxID=219809 RepID=UPI000994F448|nr:uncharacterized protein LOC109859344 [Pseudomyrmex gracilis]
MGTRDQKPRDFVALSRNLSADLRRARLTQMKWFQKYEPLLREYEKLQQEVRELYKEKRVKIEDDIERDTRTCLPRPITNSGEYGWLAAKSEFCLERYGPCVAKYPNPLKDIILLRGDIPSLASGKGFL